MWNLDASYVTPIEFAKTPKPTFKNIAQRE